MTRPFRPYHSHDEKQPLKPGEVYELDIEIIPTCIVVPKGYRIALSIRGRDYVYPGGSGGKLSNMKNEFTGNGPFLHDDPRDRPLAIYGGKTTLHLGGGRENFVLLPIIPPRKAAPAKAQGDQGGKASETRGEEKTAVNARPLQLVRARRAGGRRRFSTPDKARVEGMRILAASSSRARFSMTASSTARVAATCARRTPRTAMRLTSSASGTSFWRKARPPGVRKM